MLLLGGDRGDPVATLAKATELLEHRLGRSIARSRSYWTEPWGFAGAHLFLNQALWVDTTGIPSTDVLAVALGVERDLGRVREGAARYASRTIDIDLLFNADEVIDGPALELPHPRLHLRAFALAPAADLAPGWVHPRLGRTVLTLLDDVLQGRHG